MKTLIEYDKDWDIIFFGMCWENCRKMKKITKIINIFVFLNVDTPMLYQEKVNKNCTIYNSND